MWGRANSLLHLTSYAIQILSFSVWAMTTGLLFPRVLGWYVCVVVGGGGELSCLFIQQILSDSDVVPTLKELPVWWGTEIQT